MGLLGDLLELLDGAADSWRTARGEVVEWRDQRLVNVAFEHETSTGPRGSMTGRITARAVGPPRSAISESSHRVWVKKPSQLRVERDSSPDPYPDLLVVDGDHWWSFDPERGAVTNDGDPSYSTGGTGALALLEPSVLGAFDLDQRGEVGVAGRAAIDVAARRRPARDAWGRQPAFDMISGGEDFLLAVDAERGVLLRVVKLVDGEPAERREFASVSFDEQLDDGLFTFVPPPGHDVLSVHEIHPRFEDVTIEEAARRAPFAVFVPARLPQGGHMSVQYHPGSLGHREQDRVMLWWRSEDGLHSVHLSEAAARPVPDDGQDWDRVFREGREIFTLGPGHPMGGQQAKVELEGTAVRLGGSVELETLVAIAASLRPAPSEPPRLG